MTRQALGVSISLAVSLFADTAFAQQGRVKFERISTRSTLQDRGAESQAVAVWSFVDVTSTAGIAQTFSTTESVAWGDYDNDGDPDLYFTNDGMNRLYRNDGNDVFVDVTAVTGVGDTDHGIGTVFGDLDSDGDLDLYIVNGIGLPDLLYRNDGPIGIGGEYVFTEISSIADFTLLDSTGGVVLLDYNRDGLLDIFVNARRVDILYENKGNLLFKPVMLEVPSSTTRIGTGVVSADFNGDGWTDLFTSADGNEPSQLFINQNGVFVDESAAWGINATGLGRGPIAFDYDNDLNMDLYWAIAPGEESRNQVNRLYRNTGNDTFTREEVSSGTEDESGWAVSGAVGDVNNDGWSDFVITNGVYEGSSATVLYINNQDGTFTPMSFLLQGGIDFDARGVAFADYDNDGDLDLCITGGPQTPTRLWRNDLNNGAHYLKLILVSDVLNRNGIGSIVRVTAGGMTQVKEVSGGAGRGSFNDLPLEFGLGDSVLVDVIKITWPNGHNQQLLDVKVDQTLTIREIQKTPDFNQDGRVDVLDLLTLLSTWGECEFCATDLNNDGFVDTSDLIILLNLFFTTPAPVIGGWTEFVDSTDTWSFYVSASDGDDANDGRSIAQPVRTIARGKELVRHGYPDRLYFKRGDVWNETFDAWRKSGRSSSSPMVIGSYDGGDNSTERPRFIGDGMYVTGGSGAPDTIDFLAITDLHFESFPASSNAGIFWLKAGRNLLIENCFIEKFALGIGLQGLDGPLDDVTIRRNLIVDSYSTDSHSQGLYTNNLHGLLIEENILDHNGWHDSIPGAEPTIFNHNIYIQNGCTNVVIRRNVLSNGSSHGMQLRCGGVVDDNLVVRNSIGILVGGGTSPEPGGVVANCRGNVVLEGKNITESLRRGWGIELTNISSGSVQENIIAHRLPDTGGFPPIRMTGQFGVGVRNVNITNNTIYNWRAPLHFDSNNVNVRVLNNIVQDPYSVGGPMIETYTYNVAEVSFSGNTYHSSLTTAQWYYIGTTISLNQWQTSMESDLVQEQVSFVDPNRTTSTYAQFMGIGSTHQDFMREVRKQSKWNWRSEYTIDTLLEYFRAGYSKVN